MSNRNRKFSFMIRPKYFLQCGVGDNKLISYKPLLPCANISLKTSQQGTNKTGEGHGDNVLYKRQQRMRWRNI